MEVIFKSLKFIIFASKVNRTTVMTTKKNLNRIKGALADAGQTNKWLADQLGKDPVTISKWCTNTTQPDLQTLLKIAGLLGVNIRELIVDLKPQRQCDL